ncbi:MAG: type II toxin-antitoxin system VapC family toxin [Lewinellaceae bacterium]|nr:type II toxin-antitoxin system VapC family toxin [Phaeodactylibacter sp.]MCB9038549.1 type II toxin-antitoxin system VapC family toxin [Lewinellaceae bacterium]
MVNMKDIALDTNAAIDLLNGKSEVTELLKGFDLIFLPVTVVGELLFGAKNSSRKKENLLNFRNFIESCEVLDTNGLIAEEYSDIRMNLKEKGRPIPENDIWIAAICRSNSIPIITRDKHFKLIENLEVLELVLND